jgi:hypothetical protein
MAQIPFEVIDYTEQARTRVTEQFKNKQVFDNYVQILTRGEIDLQNTFKDLLQLRDIDSATGAQLDIIGRIVGQDRELIAADLYDFFGMIGALNAFPMGDINDPAVGGIFYSYGIDLGGNVELDDETYRIFIRAKIYKNITASTPEQFIQAIKLIFGLDQVAVVAEGDASVTVLLGGQLSNFQRVLLTYISYSQGYPSRLIPKTVGVRINFGEYIPNAYFGFADSPGALGFGDISGTYGYGLGYGLNYGQSDYTTNGGGTFATIYNNL